ncbi:hypothetical protein [Dictyobacter aurantiacus]|uniref:Uncharacterized protein n=1 Tax=Dictyobacter aurantiacus TaxID=1936993 RepID=A0A401ZAF4_9CHLR|nr:hypothetical protein [Dictyobacter aurantiacus]GCE03835.1 hypothetical protein KDAU_11640 [Dictyobacter aurantiacus]
MSQQDKSHEQQSAPRPIKGTNDVEVDADLGDSIAQELGKLSTRKSHLDAEAVKQDLERKHQPQPSVTGSENIEADTDLGDGAIASELGPLSGRRVRQEQKQAYDEGKPLSTDFEND